MTGRVSLVAHRGEPLAFPENSLPGFQHALDSGARYVECDVQITADGVPILSHDANLLKLTGKQIIIADHDWPEIRDMPAGYPDRFGDEFADVRIATLEQFVDLMSRQDHVKSFIELKEASVDYWGMKAVDLVMKALAPIMGDCILISFADDALAHARKHFDVPIGWVLPEWRERNRETARELSPEYLFVDTEFCPRDQSELFTGTWQWVAYTINTPEEVDQYAGLGIELIETDRYSELQQESDIVDVSHDF
jgi:glycerophosphoryl diester phosphodiesterase